MIEEIFTEYIKREHPLASGELLKMIRHAFYTGCWCSLGLQDRAYKLPDSQAIPVLTQLRQEIKSVVAPTIDQQVDNIMNGH